MKVLFNASMYFEKPTGVGIYAIETWKKLYKQLDEQHIEYTFYSYYNDETPALAKQKTVKLPALLELFFKRFISIHRLVWNIFYLPFIARDYDLVYSFSSHGSPFIKSQVITIHDLICFTFPKQHRFQYLYFKYILPYIIKASKKIVTVSNFTKQEVINHYKTDEWKIKVIYNGGDHLKALQSNPLADVASIQAKINGRFFLTVGASFEHKNISTLLFAKQQSGIAETLVIVGAGKKYYNYLKEIIENNKIDNIILLQYVSTECLNWLYSSCIANVYVSLYEGFGFPPLEAVMYNKVSILSDIPALREVYKDAAVFVHPNNIEEISNTLKEVASPEFNAGSYLNKFSFLINKYKWSVTAALVAELIYKEKNRNLTAANQMASSI